MSSFKGIPHIVLTVKNLSESKAFYKALFVDTLGAKVKHDGDDWYYLGLNEDDSSIGVSQCKSGFENDIFDRERVGLHHFAIELSSKKEVDKAYEKLLALDATILDAPAFYPEYDEFYYAVFYLDPSGMKMEFVAFQE